MASKYDIQYWDTDNTGGINFTEFMAIMENDEANLSDSYAQLYFDMYDMDNDGEIKIDEIWNL